MKLCTITRVMGLTGKEHFAVVPIGQPGWPLALCGPTSGPNARHNELEAQFFADAPIMMDMLEDMSRELAEFGLTGAVDGTKTSTLPVLLERVNRLVEKHAQVRKAK